MTPGKLSVQKAGYLFIALVIALTMANVADAATSWQKKEKVNIVILGDRVMDIAYHLGVYPAGMSVRCSIWPLCKEIKNLAKPLGCPRCVVGAKRKQFEGFIKQNKIKRVIVERSQPFCLLKPEVNPLNAVPILEKLGVEIEYVDFGQGVGPAIKQTAALLGKEKAGAELAEQYLKAVEKLDKKINGRKLGKRVVVLNGIYQKATGKSFIQVEAPGGYSDRVILEPLGCRNVGQAMIPSGKSASKGYLTIRKLTRLAEAKADVIVITGDSTAVQKALAAAIKENPALAGTPVYSLPLYIDSSVCERPEIVGKWLWALQ
jgi:ABC-type hemin transport system substrate-binding protein